MVSPGCVNPAHNPNDPMSLAGKYCISAVAAQQWSNLRNMILDYFKKNEKWDGVLVLPASEDGDTSSVFISKSGLPYKEYIIPGKSSFQNDVKLEQVYVKWFLEHGFSIAVDEPHTDRLTSFFGGSNDAIFSHDKSILWLGVPFMTSFEFKNKLDRFFDSEEVIVRPLELIDPNFNTLDKCFLPLSNGHLIWYPPAFSEHSRYTIETWFKGKTIEVSEEDAENLICRSLNVDKLFIFSTLPSMEIVDELIYMGFHTHQIILSEFTDIGYSARNLALKIEL